jgi:hypothetical protein
MLGGTTLAAVWARAFGWKASSPDARNGMHKVKTVIVTRAVLGYGHPML